jgi:hypothetical protein
LSWWWCVGWWGWRWCCRFFFFFFIGKWKGIVKKKGFVLLLLYIPFPSSSLGASVSQLKTRQVLCYCYLTSNIWLACSPAAQHNQAFDSINGSMPDGMMIHT